MVVAEEMGASEETKPAYFPIHPFIRPPESHGSDLLFVRFGLVCVLVHNGIRIAQSLRDVLSILGREVL